MSWMQKLYETYNNCEGAIGYSSNPKERPLLPICHVTAQAHIEIIIDGDGNFQDARLILDKDEKTTIIPSTEDSASKSGNSPATHPLCERLQYIAGDFRDFGGKVTSGFAKKDDEPFLSFTSLLSDWCRSEFSHPKARAVLKYVNKRTVIKDLAKLQIFYIGEDGKFLLKKKVQRDKNAKDIFSALPASSEQQDAFVRWIVEIDDDPEAQTWTDKTLWQSWSNYYLHTQEQEPFCLVSGKSGVLMTKHPKYIRREGDSAKIISSNDKSGFTYRGRFLDDKQASQVSLDVSHKAHYALSWLISRQGYQNGDQVVVAWATSGNEIPELFDDITSHIVDTEQDLAVDLRKKIAGYNTKISPNEDIVVIGLDSASKGRLAITYYRELKSSDFLERLENWHKTCSWQHTYRFIDKKRVPFTGAPAPKDIALAAYGVNRKKEGKSGEFKIDDNLVKTTVSRILPCIVDGVPIPRDIVESAIHKASNRIALEDWQWEKVLSIACALYKKYKEGKENYDMALDETRNTRDYLYGRLLAIADRLEEVALYKADKKRSTTATRYMQQFSQHPYRTWNQIHSALIPYMVQLHGAFFYKNMIADVKSLFESDDFINDRPLSGEYLLGYYSQRQKLFERKDETSLDEN